MQVTPIYCMWSRNGMIVLYIFRIKGIPYSARQSRLHFFCHDLKLLSISVEVKFEFYCFLTADWHERDNPPKELKTRAKRGNPPDMKQSALKSFYTHFRMDYPVQSLAKYQLSFVFCFLGQFGLNVSNIQIQLWSNLSQVISASHRINPQPQANHKHVGYTPYGVHHRGVKLVFSYKVICL